METLYNFLVSDAALIVLVAWLFIAVFWIERWQAVFSRAVMLLKEPIIFKKDHDLDIPLYPRTFFSESANNLRDTLQDPFSKIAEAIKKAGKFVLNIAYDENHKVRVFGYLMFLAFFILFVLADAIAVANTLFVMGFWSGNVPELLGRFDLAVFGDAFGIVMTVK